MYTLHVSAKIRVVSLMLDPVFSPVSAFQGGPNNYFMSVLAMHSKSRANIHVLASAASYSGVASFQVRRNSRIAFDKKGVMFPLARLGLSSRCQYCTRQLCTQHGLRQDIMQKVWYLSTLLSFITAKTSLISTKAVFPSWGTDLRTSAKTS